MTQQPILLSTVLHRVIDSVHGSLINLVENVGERSDVEKKRALYNFFESSRQQFIRLLVLVRWARGVEAVRTAQAIGAALSEQDRVLISAADRLYYISQGLQNARAPVYDVQSAIDVLTTGTYPRLPDAIAQAVPPKLLSDAEITDVLGQIERIIRFRVFTTPFPQEFTFIRIERGQLVLRVEREFQVWLTVTGPKVEDPWKLLRLDLLVPGAEATTQPQSPTAELWPRNVWLVRLRDAIQKRLTAQLQDPLTFIYRSIHMFCLNLRVKSAKIEALRLESHFKLGTVKYRKGEAKTRNIFYWCSRKSKPTVDLGKARSGTMPFENPCLQLFCDEWGQLQLRHLPPLKDPETSREAIFALGGEGKLSEELFRAMRLNSLAILEGVKASLLERLPFPYHPPSTVEPTIKQFPTREPYLDLPLFGDSWAHIFVDKGSGDVVLDSTVSLPSELLDRFRRNPAIVAELANSLLARSAHELIAKMSAAADLFVARSEPSPVMHFTYPFRQSHSMVVHVDEHFTCSASLFTNLCAGPSSSSLIALSNTESPTTLERSLPSCTSKNRSSYRLQTPTALANRWQSSLPLRTHSRLNLRDYLCRSDRNRRSSSRVRRTAQDGM